MDEMSTTLARLPIAQKAQLPAAYQAAQRDLRSVQTWTNANSGPTRLRRLPDSEARA